MVRINDNVHYRLSPDMTVVLEALAQNMGYSPANVIEQLVRQKALELEVIGPDHPEASFLSLTKTIEGWATDDPDFTIAVFKRIKATEEVRAVYDQAITPLPGQSAAKRKWHINQSIGRFCKRLLGWESDVEIPRAKGSEDTAEMLDTVKQAVEPLNLVISEVALVRA